MVDLQITDPTVFRMWIDQEQEYLQKLQEEPMGEDVLKMEYLSLLRKLESVE
jgi:hypothetical protein